MKKPVIATASLAGCFGCHMSLLDIDERILELAELVEFGKSPINDIKTFSGPCDIGLIEGGCCLDENVHVLEEFREHCRVLVSVGECAIMGGLPAMRNGISVRECLEEAYLDGPSVRRYNEKKNYTRRRGAAGTARQGLSLPRGGAYGLLSAWVSATCRSHMECTGGTARQPKNESSL